MAPEPPSADPDLLERLARHRVLGEIPTEERDWIARHGRLRRLNVGDRLSSPDQGAVEHLHIILTGRIAMIVDRPSGPRRVVEWRGGDVTGLLPYSRLSVPPGTGTAEEPTDVLAVHLSDFPEMISTCPVLTERLVQKMLDRARLFTRSDLQAEKMVALGRLAAGLAHELDNPASAVIRSARLLESLLVEADRAARQFGEADLPEDAQRTIEQIRDQCLAVSLQQIRSPLEQARREEEILDWLDARDLPTEHADVLADTPVTIGLLDSLAGSVPERALAPAIRWVSAGCAIRGIAGEIADAANRISELVGAVKGFTQMDAAAGPRPLDLARGLSQTLAVLRAKARDRGASVTLDVDDALPQVLAVGGELNQVWSNLIDNALDAIGSGGTVEVIARRRAGSVVVSIIDDGPGIPEEAREKIFDPFFTTKEIGKGTGLGLDIVRRIVINHDGTIEVDSKPGRTEFRVTLPVAGSPSVGKTASTMQNEEGEA